MERPEEQITVGCLVGDMLKNIYIQEKISPAHCCYYTTLTFKNLLVL